MKDERAHLQLFDLIARDWIMASPATGVTFNEDDSAVAFACADGSIHLATTADKEASNIRVRRAVDTARVTIAPRKGTHAPLKAADYTDGRSSAVVAHGARNFVYGKDNGRMNTLTPGGLSVYLPAKAAGPVSAVAASPDGGKLAFCCEDSVCLTAASGDGLIIISVPAGPNGLAFSPDGTSLAVSHDRGITVLAVADPTLDAVTLPVAGSPLPLQWAAGGQWLAACLGAGGFCVLNVATGVVRTHGNFPAPVRSLAFGEPTRSVVAGGAFRVAAWALDDNSAITTGKAGLVLINAVATCPARNLVAVGYANGLLSLAEIGRPSEILLREDTGAGITALAWSSDGRFLAVAGSDGSAALVDFPDSMFKS